MVDVYFDDWGFSVLSYGGGTNSTAMLIGLRDHGFVPDLILFSDTGGEKPWTYDYLKTINIWCRRNGFPEISVLFRTDDLGFLSLERECLERSTLPALAFGQKTCSQRFKIQPQNQFLNNNSDCRVIWENGGKVFKLIGIDADESHRAKFDEDKKFIYKYPLIDWDWGRDECISSIKKEGLPLPGKSSCFFCPASKKHEILNLPKDLQKRAIALEENSQSFSSVLGLGRYFSWKKFIEDSSNILEEQTIDDNCMCYDG